MSLSLRRCCSVVCVRAVRVRQGEPRPCCAPRSSPRVPSPPRSSPRVRSPPRTLRTPSFHAVPPSYREEPADDGAAAAAPPSTSRRTALTRTALAAALVSAWSAELLPPTALGGARGAEAAEGPLLADERRNVIITGCNSGIGLNGAAKLAALGYNVTLACRTMAKAEGAKAEIEAVLAANGKAASAGTLTAAECDLGVLASVRSFASAWNATGAPLDVLVCNAGVQFSGDNNIRRTDDGFEITVGTNHLGHFLLTNLLVESLAPGARVVITASEVHNPASPGGSVGPSASLGDLRGLADNGAGFQMIDGSAYNADKAYKDSKLCNVLFAQELQRRLAARGSDVTVNAFGPGLITRTGFFRNQQPLFVRVFDFATNDLFHVAETVDGGGDCLVTMVTDTALEGRGGLYYNNDLNGPSRTGHQFLEQLPSEEARDEKKAAALWAYSASLVGLVA